MGKIQINPIIGSVFLVQFPDQKTLASTMLRFQEHYESPNFRGQVFSREEFEKWYIEKKGSFSYLEDWSGFNVPSTVFESFWSGKFDPLSSEEQELLDAVGKLPKPFYLIATSENPVHSTLRHEIAHGLYATNPDYRAEVYAHLEGLQLSPIHRMLADGAGYHPAVWLDECHAYLMANYTWMRQENILEDSALKEAHLGLKGVFEFYTQGKFKE